MSNDNNDAALSEDRQVAISARLSNAVSFWGVILLSALALVAIAIMTPVVLVISGLVGVLAGDRERSTWRPARA